MTKECFLVKEVSGNWKNDSSLQSRMRTRRVLDPDSYCLLETGLQLNLDDANQECAKKTGWTIPVVMDETMIGKISTNTWISAKDNRSLPRVFKTLEGDYIPYAKWASSQPSYSYMRCVYVSGKKMFVSNCNTKRNVMCFAKPVDVCQNSPNITHGQKVINTTSKDVLYTCEEGYFMPTLNVTYLDIVCDCDWASSLQDVTNCTVIQCPPPVDHSFGTLVNVTGTRINDTALYKSPIGYVASDTGSIYFTLKCTYIPNTATGNWSAPPTLEELNCTHGPNLNNMRYSLSSKSLGSVAQLVCNDWYWMPEFRNNTVNTTCVVDKSGTFAYWCWVPQCREIICPEAPSIIMATRLVERNKTIYTCQPNYRIQGTSTNTTEIYCEYDENFEASWPSVPSCEAISCLGIPEVQRASNVTGADTNHIGATVTYQCSDGFTVYQDGQQLGKLNQFNMTCEIDYESLTGKWTGNYSCEVPQCGDPPELLNSNLTISGSTVGSIVNYTCDTNYIINSTQSKWTTSSCVVGEDAHLPYWTTAENCSAIYCDEPGDVSNAVIESFSTNIGDLARYRCKHGYKVRDMEPATKHFSVVCELTNSTLSASWSKASECEAVMCSEPLRVLNSDVLVNGYNVGDTAVYTCYTEFISNVGQTWESTCLLDVNDGLKAAWEPTEECIDMKTTTAKPKITYNVALIRQCPVPVVDVGFTAQAHNLFLQSEVSYFAKAGYFFPNGGSVRSSICSVGGHWTSNAPDVRRFRCPSLPPVIDGTKSTDENYVGTEAKIQCLNPVAKLENGLSSVNIRCTYNKEWTFIPKTCDTQRCGPFELVENSHLIAFNNTIGGLATIECNLSYRFADGARNKSFRCLADLTWESSERCYLNVCPQLQLPANGQISTDIALEGTTVQVKCLSGFMFPDRRRTRVITCNSSFLWSDLPSDCEVVRCPDPPEIENGNRTSSATSYNSTITYTCQDTYRLQYGNQQLTVRCQENAEWTYSNLSCGNDRCPPVPTVENASPSTLLAVNGTTIIYTCDKGYIFPNNHTSLSIKCNGQAWNITAQSCMKVTCPKLNLLHATVFGNGTTFGDVVKLICDEGYIYDNNITGVLECKANSQWSGDTRGCLPIDCGSPPDVKYSIRKVPASHHYGTNVSYECIPNYWFKKGITKKSVKCTRYGKWSDMPGDCKLILCPPIPVWNDMEANTTDNLVGTFVSVSCTRDKLNHSVISLCNSFGEWQPELDNCKTDKITVFEPEPEEAAGAGSIGVVVIGAMALLSVVLGISDAPVLLEAMKGRRLKRRSILHSGR